MKVWVDNLRPAPKGWIWAKTNDAAKVLLEEHPTEISLDYDMTGEKGLALAEWMRDTKHLPRLIVIHSQNEAGAKAMANVLKDSGSHLIVSPFQGKYAPQWVIAKVEAEGRLSSHA